MAPPPPAVGADAFLHDLATSLPDYLRWEWDGQHDGVVAILEIAVADQLLAILTQRLGKSWDRGSIRQAPDAVRGAPADFGGLRSGQRIFASGLADEVLLLGLWWPWGHGGTVSIRFVPYAPGADEAGLTAARDALRNAFGLT